MTTLALFDFDGTITTRDTLIEIIRAKAGSSGLFIGFLLLSPYLMAMKLGLIENWKVKEKVLKYFFGKMPNSEFEALCENIAFNHVPKLIRPKAMQAIEKHKGLNHRIVVVSASAENWVAPWCQLNKLEYLCTKLELLDGKVTGKIVGKNCYGPEKTVRIKQYLDLSQYHNIIAYGDSSGDKEMLALANQANYKPFRD